MIKTTTSFLRQFPRDLWILASGWFVGALGFAASVPFIFIYFHHELEMSATEIGLFFGVLAVARSVFQAVGGELSDHIGRTPLLVHSQVLRAASFFALAVAIHNDMGFWWVGGILLVNAIVGSAFFPAVHAMVSDILPPGKRLDGYAVSRAAGNLGWAAGPALGGFLTATSYAMLFHISAVITLLSALIFWLFLRVPKSAGTGEQFKLADLVAVKDDHNLAWHVIFIFCLYLVHAQLIGPFSVYAVDMVGISELQLGWLFTLNGILVAALQIPITRLLARYRYTTQLALGSFIYLVGYGSLGFCGIYSLFFVIMSVVSVAEMFISPASLTLTSRLAPEGRMGRYMGIHGFFVTAGWSLGPLYGGVFLDRFETDLALAWVLISSLAAVVGAAYFCFGRYLPSKFNSDSDI